MDAVERYYMYGTPEPPSIPPPPMTPPPHYTVLYVYELKQAISKDTAAFLWSFFSETCGIYFQENEPYTQLVCSKLQDVAALQKKIIHMSHVYEVRCFDTVYILPGYQAIASIE